MTAMSTSGGSFQGAPAMSSNDYYQEKRPHGMQKYSSQKFTPEQMELYKNLFGKIGEGSDLSKLAGGDEAAFKEMEAPALKQFGGIMGQMASKFSGMGMGGRKSSGFNLAGGQAASDFAQELQAKRQETKRQAMQDLMGYSQMLMGQEPMDKGFISKKEKSAGGGWGGAASGAASGAATGAALGPWGALAGGVIGGAAGYFS